MKNKALLTTVLAFFVLLGIGIGQELGWFGSAHQNQATKAKLGVLQFVSHPSLDEIYQGIQAGLEEAGYGEDKLDIQFLNGQADQSKLTLMSQELIEGGNQVLLGIATPAVQSLANASKDLPIIMGAVSDPVGARLVENPEQPGGLVTGVSDQNPAAKQVALIRSLTPRVKKIGALYSSGEDNSKSQVAEFQAAAAAAGLEVVEQAVPSTNELNQAVGVLAAKVDAIWVPIDNTIASAFSTVVAANQTAKLPLYPSATAMVEAGGLASVVVDQFELGRATGKMAARVLQGEDPGEIPIEFFSQGKPVLNMQVAKELGIVIPESIQKEAQLVGTEQ
ncbi:tryptophan ABC transporter substrate-binding protein [Streptococcus danieliae]|uniref:ABC transporter substrate-binding protein n=1 Tax=Streptococcus danieliae TaxID=747656 RepID=A0A7Z0M5Y0_9STRE|nr:tryptophan ABC transporter substrate-binding protein [Streptococcus danieliae]MBF0699313.1 ABC transporter substrate-binding protein [Streptococcus danieliae]NYS96489.1 ABC transporter substrate-binding protein [Streptococcus danieliae]